MKILLVAGVLLLACWSVNAGAAENAFRQSLLSKSALRVSSPCRGGYVHNPFSRTCMRLIQSSRSWFGAWFHCHLAGEGLVVLDTLESINWFQTLRLTNSVWKQNKGIWLGLIKTEGKWIWHGRVTKPLQLNNFDLGEPNSSNNGGECVYDRPQDDNGRYFLWDDNSCESTKWFACEKSA